LCFFWCYLKHLVFLYFLLIWKEVNKIKSSKRNLPSIVDDFNDENDIAEAFASKYMNLYSSVSFCGNDVDKLKSRINKLIDASDHNDAVVQMS